MTRVPAYEECVADAARVLVRAAFRIAREEAKDPISAAPTAPGSASQPTQESKDMTTISPDVAETVLTPENFATTVIPDDEEYACSINWCEGHGSNEAHEWEGLCHHGVDHDNIIYGGHGRGYIDVTFQRIAHSGSAAIWVGLDGAAEVALQDIAGVTQRLRSTADLLETFAIQVDLAIKAEDNR